MHSHDFSFFSISKYNRFQNIKPKIEDGLGLSTGAFLGEQTHSKRNLLKKSSLKKTVSKDFFTQKYFEIHITVYLHVLTFIYLVKTVPRLLHILTSGLCFDEPSTFFLLTIKARLFLMMTKLCCCDD